MYFIKVINRALVQVTLHTNFQVYFFPLNKFWKRSWLCFFVCIKVISGNKFLFFSKSAGNWYLVLCRYKGLVRHLLLFLTVCAHCLALGLPW